MNQEIADDTAVSASAKVRNSQGDTLTSALDAARRARAIAGARQPSGRLSWLGAQGCSWQAT